MGRHTLKPVLNVALKKYRPPENTNWNFKLLAALQSGSTGKCTGNHRTIEERLLLSKPIYIFELN